MGDPIYKKWAKVIVDYSLYIKKGDTLLIESNDICLPLVRAVYKHALKKGAFIDVRVKDDELAEIFYKNASNEQLKYISPTDKLKTVEYNAVLTISGNMNNKALYNIDPEKMATASKARSEMTFEWVKKFSEGTIKWCGTSFPTYSQAQDAIMSLSEYQDFVYNACMLFEDDPIQAWKNIHIKQQKIVDYLNKKSEITVKGNDIDLTFNCKGRKWINCDGKLNFPDGEIFTGPIENSMNGKVRFNFPAVYNGKEAEDITLVFKDGKVVKANAKTGNKFLQAMLNTDEGARYVGEFAIATNYGIKKHTKNLLFDEKIGGTIHIAIGASIPISGGINRSGIHWDLIANMTENSEILADGEVFYKNGEFII